MAETTSISVARALKLKNRVVNHLARLDGQIAKHNTAIDGAHEYDVRELYALRPPLVARLVALKMAISAANQPIQLRIFEMAEAKALVTLLNRIDTKHGAAVEGYSGVSTKHVAQLRKPDIDREVRRVEAEIDRLQEELDQFNHRTMVAVDAALLAEDFAPAAAGKDG